MPQSEPSNIVSIYSSRMEHINDVAFRVIITHIMTDHMMIRIIEKKCKDQEIAGYQYYKKLTVLHSMGLISDKIYHNLKQLNMLRNSYAHHLKLKEGIKEIKFYSSLTSDKMETIDASSHDFDFNIDWLCATVFVDMYNTAHSLGIDVNF